MSFNSPALAKAASQLDGLASRFTYPLVRIVTGLFLVPHGAQKLFGWFGGGGLEGTGQFFSNAMGMNPGVLFAFMAGSVEFFGGLAIALGLLTRPAALASAVLLAVAMTVHIPNGFFWSNGGYEYPLMWFVLVVAIFLRGGGEYSLDRKFRLPI